MFTDISLSRFVVNDAMLRTCEEN